MAVLSLRQTLIPLVSNVTGDAGSDVTDPGYWARQARAPVRFAEGVATLRRHGAGTVVEIGPRTPLLGLIARIDEGLSLLPSLRKGQEDWAMLLGSLGRLYEQGRSIDWDVVYRGQNWRRRLIPTSAFQPRRCWVEREPERGGGPEQAGLIETLAAEAERPTAADPARLYRPVWRSHTLPEVAPPRRALADPRRPLRHRRGAGTACGGGGGHAPAALSGRWLRRAAREQLEPRPRQSA